MVKRSAKSNNYAEIKKKKRIKFKVTGHILETNQANACIIQGLVSQEKLNYGTWISSNLL